MCVLRVVRKSVHPGRGGETYERDRDYAIRGAIPRGFPLEALSLFPSGLKKCLPSVIEFDLGGHLHQEKEPFVFLGLLVGQNCRNRPFVQSLGTRGM